MISPLTQKFLFFLTIPLIFLAFIALYNIQIDLNKNAIDQLKGHMLELVEHQASEITGQLDKATAIAQTTANIVGITHPINEQDIYKTLESNLNQLPIIYGSAIAYEKNTYKNHKLFAPYVYRDSKTYKHIDIAKEAYNYTDKQWQWWHGPKDLNKGIWTAPYFDEGAGDALMVTYSTPFYHKKYFTGVSTVDIDLIKLQQTLKLDALKNIQYIILTNTGHFAYHYKESLIGQSYLELANKLKLKRALVLGKEMMAGENGFYEFSNKNKKEWVFYAPIGDYGWSFAIRTSEKEANILVNQNKSNLSIWLLFIVIVGLGLTHLVAQNFILTPLKKLKEGINTSSLQSQKLPSLIQEISTLIQKKNANTQQIIHDQDTTNKHLNDALAEKDTQLRKHHQRLVGLLNSSKHASVNINQAGEILLTNKKFQTLINNSNLNNVNLHAFVNTPYKKQLSNTVDDVFKDLQIHTINNLEFSVSKEDILSCKLVFTPLVLEESDVEVNIIFLVKEST